MENKKETARPRGTDSARVIQVIETKALAGRGTEEDPCRLKTQYWSFEGDLLAVNDPVKTQSRKERSGSVRNEDGTMTLR